CLERPYGVCTGSGVSSVSSAPPASPVTTVEANTSRGPSAGVEPAAARHASTNSRVPCTLTFPIFFSLRCEAISAARCTTQSGRSPASVSASPRPSPRSPRSARVPAGSEPARRTSAPTSCSRSSSCAHSTWPMKPLAPVTRMRMTARAYRQAPAGATRADGYLVAMRMPLRTAPIGRLGCLLACALACLLIAPAPLTQAASGEPAWTTYHRDPVRSGEDPDATEPIAPTLAWHSQDLGAPIHSQPLILGSRVYVATVADDVFALDAATGAIIWQKNVGTPVPAGALPCGN